MVKKKIEEILFAHLLTGEIEVKYLGENRESIIIIYNGYNLARIILPDVVFKEYRILNYNSNLNLPGIQRHNNEEDFLKDIKKINQTLNYLN